LGSGDVATTEIDPYIHAGKSIVEIGWNKGLTIVDSSCIPRNAYPATHWQRVFRKTQKRPKA